MYSVLALFHVLISVVLIVVVLMQSQQSMNLSGMFGGASQSALGSQPQSVLAKVTTVLAIVFMLTSLLFSLVPRSEDSILSPSNIPVQDEAPRQKQQKQNQSGPAQQSSPTQQNQPAEPENQPGPGQ